MTDSQHKDIKPVSLEEEMKRSYLDYAMSVIVSRALPDVRDGLKPVHRRILYGMKEAGNDYNRPYRKSARVVGDVMGKYHPHGDSAIYDSMVRMAQEFSLRVPLIDGQGNFGSIDGDPPAAMRYTEARLSKPAHEILSDIDLETVDFQPNYDESTVEPKVLPAKYPNLLVNGASGIAVGMATNIPTHNMGEIITATCALIDNPDIAFEDLHQIVPGPDFPTGGTILGRGGIREAYRTGRGSIIIRGKHHIESLKGDRESIVITEIPFQVNKSRLIERIAEVVKEKLVEGISDLRDESDRDGMRIVIELKRDAMSDVVLNQLYRFTQLQNSFGFNMLALHHGRPEQMGLMTILKAFIEFREEVIVRRTRFNLRKAREKAHLLIGLMVAINNIDPIISLIKLAPDRPTAKVQLMEMAWDASIVLPYISLVDEEPQSDNAKYVLTDAQAQAILDLRLHRLTGLEQEKIADELKSLAEQIQEFLSILASRVRIFAIMKAELEEVAAQFPSKRRTNIEDGEADVDIEDLIQQEDMVVTVSMEGYIKRVPLATYRAQRRGGKGRSGMATKDADVVSDIFVANTHQPVLFFSTLGRVYELKVYKLPLATPQSKGRPMVNMLPLTAGETIATVMVMPEETLWDQMNIIFATSNGNVRRNRLSDFTGIRGNGKIAIKLDEGEALVSVATATENEHVMIATRQGSSIRFAVADLRVFSGRDSNGVRGIKLREGNHVISMTILNGVEATSEERQAYLKSRNLGEEAGETDEESNVDEGFKLSTERYHQLAAQEQFILSVTERGFGKRTSSFEYRTTGRGGVGIENITVNTRNGGVTACFPVKETDQIMLVSDQGQLIRCPVHDIRIAGRRTQGVTIFRLADGEKVVAVSLVEAGEEDEEEVVEILS